MLGGQFCTVVDGVGDPVRQHRPRDPQGPSEGPSPQGQLQTFRAGMQPRTSSGEPGLEVGQKEHRARARVLVPGHHPQQP